VRFPAVTGAVLAGGRSHRMGSDKGRIRIGNRRLIDVVLEAIRPLFPETVIVANETAAYDGLGVPVVPDRIPDKGPLGGIHAALCSSRLPHTFCVACDMPLVNPAVVAHLCALAPGYDAVVPEWEAGYEPLLAVYGESCLPHVERMVREDRLRVDALFSAVRVRRVAADELRPLDPLLRSFMNVNTPDELEAARQVLGQGGNAACES
jgi:molybdopterin-guanine dinucleotide biosynthesis protein A